MYQDGFLNVTLYITKDCILDCKYCFVKKEKSKISWKTAKRSVDFILTLNFEKPQITFFGGEPLLEWNLIQKITAYAEKKGMKRFNIATNLMLVDENILAYFNEHNFVPQIALDGEKISHDIERVYHDKCGSFEIVDKKLDLVVKCLKDRKVNVRVTFTPNTVKYLGKTVKYIIQKGLTWQNVRINIMPVVTHRYRWEENSFRIFREEIFEIAEIFLESLNRGLCLNICSCECIPEDYHLINLVKLKEDPTCRSFHCYTGRSQLMIDEHGNIYPCGVYEALPSKKMDKYFFGDIWRGFTHPRRLEKYRKTVINPHLSCCAYNILMGNNPSEPAATYSELYRSWLTASEFVNKKLAFNEKYSKFL